MKFPLTIIILTLAALASYAQAPAEALPDSVIDDVYLARDDGNGKAGDVVETFSTRDIPIYCIVSLTRSSPINVKMNLLAVKVNGVKPETKVVTAGYTTKQGQDRVYFTGRPDRVWVAGTYRIDVFVEGKRERSLMFEMKGDAAPVGASKFVPSKPAPAPARKPN